MNALPQTPKPSKRRIVMTMKPVSLQIHRVSERNRRLRDQSLQTVPWGESHLSFGQNLTQVTL